MNSPTCLTQSPHSFSPPALAWTLCIVLRPPACHPAHTHTHQVRGSCAGSGPCGCWPAGTRLLSVLHLLLGSSLAPAAWHHGHKGPVAKGLFLVSGTCTSHGKPPAAPQLTHGTVWPRCLPAADSELLTPSSCWHHECMGFFQLLTPVAGTSQLFQPLRPYSTHICVEKWDYIERPLRMDSERRFDGCSCWADWQLFTRSFNICLSLFLTSYHTLNISQ